MKKDEVRGLLKQYLDRYEDFNKQLKDESSCDIKSIKSFRDSQLSTFLADAITLKDIVLNDKQECIEPKSITLNQQYYLLSEKQLKAYMSFRTFAKRGIYLDNNNSINFLLMYLMEIVNGIHGDLIEKKCKLLNSVFCQYMNYGYDELSENCIDLISEAYTVVYLQNINNIKKETFENKCNPMFEDTTLEYGSDLEDHSKIIEKVLQLTNFDNNDNFTHEEKKLIRFSFKRICAKINQMNYSYFDFLYLPELFEVSYEEEIFNSFSRIKALYPISVNEEFINFDNMVKECFKCGIHSSSKLYFKDDQLKKINLFFRFIINAINHHLKDVALPIVNAASLISQTNRLYSVLDREYNDSQNAIDDIVGNWFIQNPYVKVLYKNNAEDDLIKYVINYPKKAKKRFADFEKGLSFDEDKLDENGDRMDAYDIMIRDWNAYLEYGRS